MFLSRKYSRRTARLPRSDVSRQQARKSRLAQLDHIAGIKCKTEYPSEEMMQHVKKAEVPHCVSEGCDGVVKPDIVFFGEGVRPDSG